VNQFDYTFNSVCHAFLRQICLRRREINYVMLSEGFDSELNRIRRGSYLKSVR